MDMTPEERRRLLDLGIAPHHCDRVSNETRWNQRFELLREFKEEFGHCNVQRGKNGQNLPKKYKNLVCWVGKNRELLKHWDDEDPTKNGNLTAERRQRLLDLGFIVDVKSIQWEEKFKLLQEYKQEYGDCNVPKKSRDPKILANYKSLGIWVHLQRRELREYENGNIHMTSDKKPNHMTAERRQRLLDLGFVFKNVPRRGRTKRAESFEATFQQKLQELKAFKAKHGHVNLEKGSTLNAWLNVQRRNYAVLQEGVETTYLKQGHVDALTSLGFCMTNKDVRKGMKDRIPEYVQFVQVHGRFPQSDSNNAEERLLANAAVKWRQRRNLLQVGVKKTRMLGSCEIPPDLVAALDLVNFRWETREGNLCRIDTSPQLPWEARYELLKAYKEQYGHCQVPKSHSELGSWVVTQRRHYRLLMTGKRSVLTMERFRKLSELEFHFKAPEKPARGKSRRQEKDDSDSGSDSSSSSSNDEEETGKCPAAASNNAATLALQQMITLQCEQRRTRPNPKILAKARLDLAIAAAQMKDSDERALNDNKSSNQESTTGKRKRDSAS